KTGDGRQHVVGRKRQMLDAGAEYFRQEAGRLRASTLGGVEDDAQRSVGSLDHLAPDESARISDVLGRNLLEIEQRGIKQQPGQHLLVVHGLGNMVDDDKAGRIGGILPRVGELDVPDAPELAARIEEVDEAAADAAHGRDVELAGTNLLAE